jgi:hypothetical protein
MPPLTEFTNDEMEDARRAAETLISEKFRGYLPGRMLPMLIGRFRDDVAESLGMELPALPQRSGPVRSAKLDELTSSELEALLGAVVVLVSRFISLMGDPLLPVLLRELREALVIEKADRGSELARLTDKAKAP